MRLIGNDKRRKMLAYFFLQKGRCAICGEIMSQARGHAHHPTGWTEEHVTPQAQGGGRNENLVLTHSSCNNKKGGDMPLTYLKRMAKDLNRIYQFLSQNGGKLNRRQKDILYGRGEHG